MMKAELADRLGQLGRHEEASEALGDLRSALDETVVELRSIMAELRAADDETLKNHAA